MQIIKDRDLIFDVDQYDAVLVGTGIYNMLTQGFQCKMTVRYPYVEAKNMETKYADTRKLGTNLVIENPGDPVIMLLYICGYPSNAYSSLSYKALAKCVRNAAAVLDGRRVCTTVLGSTRFDGLGDKDRCLKIIEEECGGMDLYVYDYEQMRKRDEVRKVFKEYNAEHGRLYSRKKKMALLEANYLRK